MSPTSFATGVTYLRQMTIVAWALAIWAFTFSFNFNLNMEVSMIAHVDMFGVAAALWSLVGKLQSTQRWRAIDNSEARRDAAVGVRFPRSTQLKRRSSGRFFLWVAGSRPQAECLIEAVSNRKVQYRAPSHRVGRVF